MGTLHWTGRQASGKLQIMADKACCVLPQVEQGCTVLVFLFFFCPWSTDPKTRCVLLSRNTSQTPKWHCWSPANAHSVAVLQASVLSYPQQVWVPTPTNGLLQAPTTPSHSPSNLTAGWSCKNPSHICTECSMKLRPTRFTTSLGSLGPQHKTGPRESDQFNAGLIS